MSTGTLFLLLMEIHLPKWSKKHIIWKERILILKTLFWIWINSVYKISTSSYFVKKRNVLWFNLYTSTFLCKLQITDVLLKSNAWFLYHFEILSFKLWFLKLFYKSWIFKLQLKICTWNTFDTWFYMHVSTISFLDNYNQQALAFSCFSLSQKTPQ